MGTAVIFPGQGSQFVGMADPWRGHPAGAAVLEEASATLGTSILDGSHDEEALATTSFVQPALLACDIAAYRVLRAEGLADVVGVAGHLTKTRSLVVIGIGLIFLATFVLPLATNVLRNH